MSATKMAERRLVLRVLARWETLCDRGALPKPDDVGPSVFGDDWDWCSLWVLSHPYDQSENAFIGEALSNLNGTSVVDQACDVRHGTLVGEALNQLGTVITSRAPVCFGGEAQQNNGILYYRYIILPLSTDNIIVDHALIAANGRVFKVDRNNVDDQTDGSRAGEQHDRL